MSRVSMHAELEPNHSMAEEDGEPPANDAPDPYYPHAAVFFV
jgi:hypothetical protein